MLAPILPLSRHVAPDLALPVEPFGCLALACLLVRRSWPARPLVISVLVAGALVWGFVGMRGRLQLRDERGLPADPTVRHTAASWEACRHLQQLPLDDGGLVLGFEIGQICISSA